MLVNFSKMFSGCINLNNFLLPKNLTLNCTNFENVDFSEMFSDCSSLTSIDLSGIEFKGINNVNNMFLNCENIESIKLRGTLNIMPISESICSEFMEVTICVPNNNTKIEIFPRINSLRRLNLFDLKLNLTLIDLEDLQSLEECLYYEGLLLSHKKYYKIEKSDQSSMCQAITGKRMVKNFKLAHGTS